MGERSQRSGGGTWRIGGTPTGWKMALAALQAAVTLPSRKVSMH